MNHFEQRHYQALVQYLKDGLRSGSLTKDSRLPSEVELAEKLSFSVPSLREALHLLETFGLVRQEVDGGFRMSQDVGLGFSDMLGLFLLMEDLSYQDVIRMRRSIELQSLPAICANITDSEKQTLYFCIVRMMAGPRGDRRADDEFHDVLVSVSRDKLAASLNRALVQFTGPGRKVLTDEYDTGNWQEIVQLHMNLYQAIKANDPERAAEAVHMHYDTLLRLNDELLKA